MTLYCLQNVFSRWYHLLWISTQTDAKKRKMCRDSSMLYTILFKTTLLSRKTAAIKKRSDVRLVYKCAAPCKRKSSLRSSVPFIVLFSASKFLIWNYIHLKGESRNVLRKNLHNNNRLFKVHGKSNEFLKKRYNYMTGGFETLINLFKLNSAYLILEIEILNFITVTQVCHDMEVFE